jgi:type I restriction enzyme R subunit
VPYVRGLNGTKALDVVEKQKYINQRWPSNPETP